MDNPNADGENGFGYDPVFFDKLTSKTAGQMLREEKLVLSHRGKALKLILENLKKSLNNVALAREYIGVCASPLVY